MSQTNMTRLMLGSAVRLAGLIGLIVATATGAQAAPSTDIVISQVYGGGGNSGATYKNDFIELHNIGSTAVSLNGWSVQYASATGTTWTNKTNLSNVTLQPGQYYLIQEAAGTGGTTNLPTPDATGNIAMSGTAGKVALVTNTTALACGSTCATDPSVRDFVGFGNTANNYEGAGPTTAPSNTTAVLRGSSGCTDTDNNNTDFTAAAPSPRNTGATIQTCGAPIINGTCGSADGQSFTSAPTSGLCSTGVASSVSGSGPWTWTCEGSGGGSTDSCSASVHVSSGGPFSILHVNDTHARITPHKWLIPSMDGSNTAYEDVGGAAFMAGKMLQLADANSLVLDGGDISEGNPVGDFSGSPDDLHIGGYTITGCATPSDTSISSNCGMTQFYQLLSQKLLASRGRGMDAVVVGNHDVRDIAYIQNLERLRDSGVPVLSVNVQDIATHTPHFAPYTVVTVNGTKVGILGYTTQASEVGASLSSTLEVVPCDWSAASNQSTATSCHLSEWVNTLRNTEHVDVVVLLAHIGHGALVDQNTSVGATLLVDDGSAKLPEVVVTGHWHTWAETVWQPMELNYKSIFTESASYMKYIGQLNVDASGKYLSASQHVLRNADITPDADVQRLVDNLTSQYNAAHPLHVDTVVGYTADNLMLDNDMRWWSPDEYPWSGNNTAGQWITDAMQWKCAQLFGSCDLAVEAGGGVRSDIPAGPVTMMQVYETFPWADDTFVRVDMNGQDIINFLKATDMNAGFSSRLHVAAKDGVPTSVTFYENGQWNPIDLNRIYTVAINNYMYDHPPSGYAWPTHSTALADSTLMRDGIIEFMQSQHATPATAYQVGGPRYDLSDNEFSGGYRAVVTMMDDNDTRPTFDAAFVRFLSATPETLVRRGGTEVPANLVNADGSVNPANRLSAMEIYRSHLGFKPGLLQPGDIVEFWGKASFYGGNPEFVDQEGIVADGVEFKIVGHDASLAKPIYQSSIGAFLNDASKNQYVRFLALKTGTNTVADQSGQSLTVYDETGYTKKSLPGTAGSSVLEISGVLTMESFGYRFRADSATVSSSSLPASSEVSSAIDPLVAEASAPITLTATAAVTGGGYDISPSADSQIASGKPTSNYGTSTNLYIQSSSTSSYGNERAWLKFDLSSIPSGSTITSATLKMWNWKSAGASLPVEVRSANDDSWTETGITWNTQPTPGGVLDSQTLTSGTTDVWYDWNVTAFVQSEFSGDKTVSLLAKAATEDSADSTAPSYAFDAKEYGSNVPVLHVTTQADASSVANVRYFYRYSSDNASWGSWTSAGTATSAPYGLAFSFPDGYGYYEFYTVATDNLGGVESTPAYAQAAVHYQAASGAAQTLDFDTLPATQAGSTLGLSATASSGLPVTFTSLTTGKCTVSGSQVTTVAAGVCTISASQNGAVGYVLPASRTQSFDVLAIAQTIDFPALSSRTLSSGDITLGATASSGLTVAYTSATPAVCSVSGNIVSLLAVGTCTLTADQAGDAAYSAAPSVTQSFQVTAAASSADVPMPIWAMLLLAMGMLEAMRRRMQGRV